MKLAEIKKFAKKRAKKKTAPTATYKNPYGGVGYLGHGHENHNHTGTGGGESSSGGDGGGGGGE